GREPAAVQVEPKRGARVRHRHVVRILHANPDREIQLHAFAGQRLDRRDAHVERIAVRDAGARRHHYENDRPKETKAAESNDGAGVHMNEHSAARSFEASGIVQPRARLATAREPCHSPPNVIRGPCRAANFPKDASWPKTASSSSRAPSTC